MAPTVKETHIDGVLIVQGVRFNDERGFFKELYNEHELPQVHVDRFRQVVPIIYYRCSRFKLTLTTDQSIHEQA
jgi:dTDP-4-dehydrorhamnose 3,5-epimerase-like enzyme